MSSLRLASLYLAAAACTSSTPKAVDRPPPPMPARMIAIDFAAMVEHNVLTPIELPVVDRAEVSILDEDGPAPDGHIVLSNALPGGWSQSVYADGAHRLWIVSSTDDPPHVPDGVIISATRVFRTTLTIPPGYVLGGHIEII